MKPFRYLLMALLATTGAKAQNLHHRYYPEYPKAGDSITFLYHPEHP